MIWMVGVIVLMVVAAACGTDTANKEPTPTLEPANTDIPPTPRSTALPTLPPNTARLGDTQNPITILFATTEDTEDSGTDQALEGHFDRADLTVTVEFESDSAALQQVCGATEPTAAWVSPFTFAAAFEQCGAVPMLAVVMEDDVVGRSTAIVARPEINTLRQLAGRTFCRSAQQDEFYSWVLPSLLLASNNVSPFPNPDPQSVSASSPRLEAVEDYVSDSQVVTAMASGDCDAAAFDLARLPDVAAALASQLSTASNRVAPDDVILFEGGPIIIEEAEWEGFEEGVIPFAVFMFPPDGIIYPELRDQITETLVDFFADRSAGEARAEDLLAATGVMTVSPEDLQGFLALVNASHWEMAFDR